MKKNNYLVGLIALLAINYYTLAYPSDLKDQIILVFNTLTGKDCNHIYDTAKAIYRNQANKYNLDITPFTSYEKAKSICYENRYICSKQNNKLLYSIDKIKDKNNGYKIVQISFFSKKAKNLKTRCNFIINTKQDNRGYPISFPELSKNLESCISKIENRECVVNALTNIYTTLETIK